MGQGRLQLVIGREVGRAATTAALVVALLEVGGAGVDGGLEGGHPRAALHAPQRSPDAETAEGRQRATQAMQVGWAGWAVGMPTLAEARTQDGATVSPLWPRG